MTHSLVKTLALERAADAAVEPKRPVASQVLAGVQEGREEAMRAMYSEHYPAVLRHLRALTGDADAATDLAQEVFVRAWTNIDRFRGESPLATWLHGIAVNLARAGRTKSRRRASIAAGVAPKPRVGASPEDELIAEQARVRLYDALDRLPAPQREAFVLRVIEQLPLEECAQVLGAPISTISYRAREAQARVRAWMEGNE